MKRVNKKVKFDYKIIETIEAGISLTGAEVKAVKEGNVDLEGSHAKVINGEVYLLNANIGVKKESTRTRKLLLHKKQITSIESKVKAKSLTLVPVSMYTKGRLVKVKLALAKPKKKFEKKEAKKKRDIEREVERELKNF